MVRKYCNFEVYAPEDKTDDMQNTSKINQHFTKLVKKVFDLEFFNNNHGPDVILPENKRFDHHIKEVQKKEIDYINELKELNEIEKEELIKEKKAHI